jgi:hypothetical protein
MLLSDRGFQTTEPLELHSPMPPPPRSANSPRNPRNNSSRPVLTPPKATAIPSAVPRSIAATIPARCTLTMTPPATRTSKTSP